VESLNRLPQFPQNRIPGGLANPQLGHSFGMMKISLYDIPIELLDQAGEK
jgi:hypothetical protein